MKKELIQEAQEEKNTYSNITNAALAALEATHQRLKKIEVRDEKTNQVQLFCFRPPTRNEVRIAQGVLVKTRSVMDYADVLINACLLNDKETVHKDDEVYFAIQRHMEEIVTDKLSELKK